MTVSVSFVSASLSNAKQEKTVDMNNLAVVAAEMGVDYYVNKMKIKESEAFTEARKKIEPDISKFNMCNRVGYSELSGCMSVKTKEEIEYEAKSLYEDYIKDAIKDFKNESPQQIGSGLLYELQDYNYLKESESIKIVFNIIGTSPTIPGRLLNTTIQFQFPVFVGFTDSNEEDKFISTLDDVFDYFSSNKTYFKKNPCGAQNDCDTGNYYSEGNITVGNQNTLTSVFWIHKGLLSVGNMNSMGWDVTLLIESLDAGNGNGAAQVNNMDSKLILLGKDNHAGNINQSVSISFSLSGSLCINIDGYSKSDVEKISIKNNPDQVFFFSNAGNPEWPSNSKDSLKVTGSLSKFITDCTGVNLFNNNGLQQTSVGNTNFIVEVDY